MKLFKNHLLSFGILPFLLLPLEAVVLDITHVKPEGQVLHFDESQGKVYEGEATYYHNKFHGRKTASGERYNKRKYTAAIQMDKIKVPFGTIVEVTNVVNGKSVQVKVNDRMPKRSSAIIDLSRKAAEDIGMIDAGRVKVEVRVIE